jgi:hypothetical protein
MFEDKPDKTTFNPLSIGNFFGISTGCFFGTGYGFIIGFGKVKYNSKGACIIYPCRNPFLHGGFLTGCYCGIAVGFGFGNGLANTIGITKKLKITFPSHWFTLFDLIRDKK